jgi:hypothetical protein
MKKALRPNEPASMWGAPLDASVGRFGDGHLPRESRGIDTIVMR